MPGSFRELKPQDANSNPDGPLPAAPDRPGAECPNCFNGTGPGPSSFCDQCGQGLASGAEPSSPETPGLSSGGYQPVDSDTVQCPSCAAMNQPEALFCRNCGESIPSSAYAATATGATAASMSSGRRPGTSPAGRRDFLDALSDPLAPNAGRSLAERIAIAERLVAQCEQDHADALGDMHEASFFPPMDEAPKGMTWTERSAWLNDQRALDAERRSQVTQRHLSPADRSAWLHEQNAMDRERRASDALDTARSALNRLLAQWGNVERLDLGLPPGGDLYDGNATLQDFSRAAERRDRQDRLR